MTLIVPHPRARAKHQPRRFALAGWWAAMCHLTHSGSDFFLKLLSLFPGTCYTGKAGTIEPRGMRLRSSFGAGSEK
jgi:hypothetical protein